MIRAFLLICLICLGSYAEASTRNFRVRPDGDIRFDVPLDGPTRISVAGDRIAKIVQSHSNFEMTNDENTGDVFLRFVGQEDDVETGYIITEAGHTIGFTMNPKPGLDKQTVLINLVGVEKKQDDETSIASSSEDDGFAFAVGGGGHGGRAGMLVEFAKEAFNTRVGNRTPTKAGQFVFAKSDLRARIFTAPALNGIPAHQSFNSGSKTLAVLVDDVVVNGRVWVVVVESAR